MSVVVRPDRFTSKASARRFQFALDWEAEPRMRQIMSFLRPCDLDSTQRYRCLRTMEQISPNKPSEDDVTGCLLRPVHVVIQYYRLGLRKVAYKQSLTIVFRTAVELLHCYDLITYLIFSPRAGNFQSESRH